MIRLPPIALLALIVAGCEGQQPLVWHKAGATDRDYQAASYECERDTRMAAASFGGGLNGAGQAEAFAARCMSAKGFNRVPASAATAPLPQSLPVTPMRDANGTEYQPADMVLCTFPNVAQPVKFNARTCSQGGGAIVGPATKV